jgi:anaerobic magnesium-protoporphyrin IX monomethyl ester cyclase
MKSDTVILFLPKANTDGSSNGLPYSLLYLERVLRDLDLRIILLDESQQPDYMPLLRENRNRLLLAGVSSLTGYQIYGGVQFSRKVRETCKAPVVWGGWHPTLLPEQTLAEEYVDYVVIGQGERPLRRLVERLRNGQDTCDIPGLGFKRGREISINQPEPIADFNSFPNVNFDLVDLNNAVYCCPPYMKRSLGYFTSHGCPFHCAFCSVAKVYGRRWFHKPVAQIIEELRYMKEHAGIDGISLEDDNFFVKPDFCRELAQAMIDAKLNLKWSSGAHPRLMTENFSDEDIRLFARAGCWRIYIGAESGDQEVLDIIDKKSKVDHTYRFVKMLRRHGIVPRLSTMVCLPMNPTRDFRLTIDMIGRAKLIDPRLEVAVWFYTPYPGTQLFETAKQKGFVAPHSLEGWANHTLRAFKAPWAPKGIERRLKVFTAYYFSLLDSRAYRRIGNPALRMAALPINKVLFSFVWLRFKTKWFGFPSALETAIILQFVRILKYAGKTAKKRFSR